jgi:hypothetical protein
MEKDKYWKIGLLAGGAIVGIFALRYFLTPSEEERSKQELEKDVKKLGSVSKDSSGTIKVQDFIELFKIITKYSKLKIKRVKRESAAKRRKFFDDEQKYRELVTEQIKEEEQIYQDYANYVMDYFSISEHDFLIAQQVHMANPLFQRTMASIQNDLDDLEKFVPAITKDKTKEIFMYVEDQKFKAMEKIMRRQAYGDPANADTTITLLVEHSRIEDMIHEKYGVEADELQK